MTEQEAIKALKLEGGIEITGRAKRYADFCMALDIAIKALEEVQEYRMLGIVEELKTGKRYMELAKMHGTIGKVIDKCAEYEENGTVEECREAVEKQKVKKPTIGADYMVRRDDNGEPIWQHHYIDYICSECGLGIAEEYICCPYCGTYIDWSEKKDGNQ